MLNDITGHRWDVKHFPVAPPFPFHPHDYTPQVAAFVVVGVVTHVLTEHGVDHAAALSHDPLAGNSAVFTLFDGPKAVLIYTRDAGVLFTLVDDAAALMAPVLFASVGIKMLGETIGGDVAVFNLTHQIAPRPLCGPADVHRATSWPPQT